MERQESKATLRKLSDSELTLENAGEDIRACKVIDSSGEELGHVDDLIIDDERNKVRLIRVASGGFLGLGETKFLIPVEAITSINDDTVQISQSQKGIAGSPRYNPELVDETYYNTLYGYYGYVPFGGYGYVDPKYPRL